MILFDVLDVLEQYVTLHPMMQNVITILDRSLPYEQADGLYDCPEQEALKYKVETFVTSKGLQVEHKEGFYTLEITLRGDQLVAFDIPQAVYHLTGGRFLLTDQDYKRAIAPNLTSEIKTVQFYLPKLK